MSRYNQKTGQLRAFMRRHYTNFNSREVIAAAEAYVATSTPAGR